MPVQECKAQWVTTERNARNHGEMPGYECNARCVTVGCNAQKFRFVSEFVVQCQPMSTMLNLQTISAMLTYMYVRLVA